MVGDEYDEQTVQVRMHFSRDGRPVSCPPGAEIVWRVSAYACIRDSENRILMIVPPWSDLYELPGGLVDVKNTLEYGLKERVKRETGMRVSSGSSRPMYVGESNFYDGESEQYCHSVYFVFDCQDVVVAGMTVPITHDQCDPKRENTRIEWIQISDLNDQNIHPMHHQLLEYFGVDQ
jgi:ADP-ribose pyrophosphatase YjhB (NUDIX family)